MGVWVAVPLVMDGKVGNHAFGNKKLPAVAVSYTHLDVYKRQVVLHT